MKNIPEREWLDALPENVRNGNQPLTINPTDQNRHIKDTDEYTLGRSYIYGDIAEAQALVNQYAGTGVFELDRSDRPKNKEIITADKIIGVVISESNAECSSETHSFKIHYSKSGVHIVPRKD